MDADSGSNEAGALTFRVFSSFVERPLIGDDGEVGSICLPVTKRRSIGQGMGMKEFIMG